MEFNPDNLTDKDIVTRFKKLRQKFNGWIRIYKLKVYTRVACLYGQANYKSKLIRVNLRSPDPMNVLLHECVHAYLYEAKGARGHTKRFWRTFQRYGGEIMGYNKQMYKKAVQVDNERGYTKDETSN
ncbi:hypothetical protein LCGC14_2297540 [marine sediment metagenome]|uniref:SprT-like domain-containing protein n=1 Tax=marine sediment metagenome TaxID=412755 RepID=A0A0F9CPD4_9ZZZZ